MGHKECLGIIKISIIHNIYNLAKDIEIKPGEGAH